MKDRITIEWTTQDVLNLRPDLTNEEALKVLTTAVLEHDADWGINNFMLQDIADRLFEEKTDEDLKVFSVKVGRRIVEQCYIEIEALSEQHAREEVERLILSGEFHDLDFTTTAITNEEIFDVSEKA